MSNGSTNGTFSVPFFERNIDITSSNVHFEWHKEGLYNFEINEDWHKWGKSVTLWLDSDRYCCKVACCKLKKSTDFKESTLPRFYK